MTLSYSGVKSDVEREEAFELIEQDKRRQIPSLDFIDDDATDASPRMPPKALHLRSTKQTVRLAFWTGFVTLLLIVGLSVLASNIQGLLPDLSMGATVHSPVSCDLTVSHGGSLQGAFTINLRGASHLTFTEAKAMYAHFVICPVVFEDPSVDQSCTTWFCIGLYLETC